MEFMLCSVPLILAALATASSPYYLTVYWSTAQISDMVHCDRDNSVELRRDVGCMTTRVILGMETLPKVHVAQLSFSGELYACSMQVREPVENPCANTVPLHARNWPSKARFVAADR